MSRIDEYEQQYLCVRCGSVLSYSAAVPIYLDGHTYWMCSPCEEATRGLGNRGLKVA